MIDKHNPEEYTRDELCVYANGVAAVAQRVIKQWELDGRPKNCIKMIEAWKRIGDEALALKDHHTISKMFVTENKKED